ncbi:MAG: hypothetical protein WC430_02830 [Patescibacteria group bacterium]
MKKRALKIFLFAAVLVLVAPIFVFATNGTDKYGIERAADTAGLQRSIGGETTVPGVIGSVISAGLALLGVLFFLLILYSGFIWMKAMGKSDEVTKAKDTMEAAVVGLVLVLAAYALANFVFGSLTGGGEEVQTTTAPCAQRTESNCISGGECMYDSENGCYTIEVVPCEERTENNCVVDGECFYADNECSPI